MSYRPATIHARRQVLTAAARFTQPFTIEDVWDAVGHSYFPSYQHVQTLLRELYVDGQLELHRQPGRAAKPVYYRWTDDEDERSQP